ncbi:hypothetical protein NIES2111_64130 (plasmid) [Nostoc sp. NIES-2111]|nr:hypothetical protein NIES2111_64130 [Nostoc sp. NIES-2111]
MNPLPRKRKATSASSINPESPNSDISTEDPASATIDVAAVEVPELTPEEQRDRLNLERKVERAFFEAGKALMELRDRRLYRSTHRTFEEYCRDRFGHSRQQSNYLIAAAQVYENLITIGCQNVAGEDLTINGCQNVDEEDLATNGCQNVAEEDLTTNETQVLPTSERQVRPLTQLEPQQQRKAWQEAVQVAGGKVPSGRIVKDAVQRIMESTKVANPYYIGEVCQFFVKDNPDLRGMGGCWCIITYVGQFSCTVRAWNGEYNVRIDHLKPLNYSDAECQQMREIYDRITRLRDCENLEEAARAVLKHLGKVRRAYLTDVEEKFLSLIEQEYGVGLSNLYSRNNQIN